MKEYEEILRKRIYLRRLPSHIDQKINETIGPIELLLANPLIDKDRRASLISACSKTITQYKFDLMTINLDAIQTIQRAQQELLVNLRQQLAQSDASNEIKGVIGERMQALTQRHDTYLTHKLRTFFDKAPTAAKH